MPDSVRRMTEQGAHERSGPGRRGQGLSGAVVAAQAGGEAAGAEAGRAGAEAEARAGAGGRNRGRAGVRSLQPAEAGGDDGRRPISPRFCARAFPNICAMRRCENPGRWIPRSAITSIPRSNTPMTGTRRAACRAPARSAPAWMSRGWFRRSWATANRRPNLRWRPPSRKQPADDPAPSAEQCCAATGARAGFAGASREIEQRCADTPRNSAEATPNQTPRRSQDCRHEVSDSAAPQQPVRRHGSAKPVV